MIELAIYLAFVGTFLWWMIVLVPWRPWNTQESLESTNDEKLPLDDITVLIPTRSMLWVMALPIIGTLFLLMTWTSAFRFWRGERAQWKNRRYEISA
ncbi:hypothetical protein [Nitrosomonas sp. Is37]|uniref:hypothetical protein n=1 Tax=Nitrosomonas sp. Is37 TaxID=3080535 RepID=UPI00294B062B|nr:hypothetical protein [Nitrosomonas sp. Is37]MDV6344487.1 hypothetical protein [Nitrosomonas sp. Is37]